MLFLYLDCQKIFVSLIFVVGVKKVLLPSASTKYFLLEICTIKFCNTNIYSINKQTVKLPLTNILYYSGHVLIQDKNVAVQIEFALHVIIHSSSKCRHLTIL